MNHASSHTALPFFLAALATAGSAQGSAFQSPGQSTYSRLGQTTRFSSEFNPAIGFVIDGLADFEDVESGNDGYDAVIRQLELNASAYVDPKAWAYVVLTSEDLETPQVEEAAVEYIGFEGNSTLRAGRFFVDFGKQMQTHLEELRTLERPLVLREYLGEELAGTGLQYDSWFAAGETTPVRFSLGAFASLLNEGHGEEDGDPEPLAAAPERKDVDELSFVARVTGMSDVGASGQLQLGASTRYLPAFGFEFDDGTVSLGEEGLSNVVYGADVTYGWSDETGQKRFVAGGEALLLDGDVAAALDDPAAPTRIDVTADSLGGFYTYADFAWDPYNSVGVQYSLIEAVEDPDGNESELDLYYTRHFTEFRRLRLGVTLGSADEPDADFLRVYLQFTSFFGSHSHGVNW